MVQEKYSSKFRTTNYFSWKIRFHTNMEILSILAPTLLPVRHCSRRSATDNKDFRSIIIICAFTTPRTHGAAVIASVVSGGARHAASDARAATARRAPTTHGAHDVGDDLRSAAGRGREGIGRDSDRWRGDNGPASSVALSPPRRDGARRHRSVAGAGPSDRPACPSYHCVKVARERVKNSKLSRKVIIIKTFQQILLITYWFDRLKVNYF